MFCLLAVLFYLNGKVSKKGCQCSCPVERKENCKRLSKKVAYWKKNHKKAQKCRQTAIFSSKSATESLNSQTFCFYLHLRWWYGLVCK